jgi:hypothetical protein
VIAVAVRGYLRYGLSHPDVEELLAERGVEVDHVAVYRRVQRVRAVVGDRWFAEETCVKVNRVWCYACRAVDPGRFGTRPSAGPQRQQRRPTDRAQGSDRAGRVQRPDHRPNRTLAEPRR